MGFVHSFDRFVWEFIWEFGWAFDQDVQLGARSRHLVSRFGQEV